MKTIDEIRRANLAAIVAERGGVSSLAELLHKSSSQISQWLNASTNSGTGKPRGMRSSSCREIERACQKARGWMEVEHPAAGFGADLQRGATPPTAIGAAPGTGDEMEIPRYKETGASMGGRVALRDQPGEILTWRVTPEWICKNIKNHNGVGNLCLVTGFGNSMQPLYNPGDPLILDRSIKSVEFDATYFFRVGDEGFIKILQRVPGEGIRVISKNKDYETWTIKPDMDFEVFGQILKAWCGTDT